ncbi:MAG: YHS domain-containing (seleno)protein [Burkholderiales bacterium]|nr:YHS domain-containing (seleno)protein [Burkholderiales bacterium]
MTASAFSVPLRLSRLAAIALLAPAVLSGCTAMSAQNPSGKLKPVNAVADGGDERVMLKGADVVAYFTQGRYVQGTPQLRSVHEGVTFRFASAEHKAAFDAAPQKYLPQYGGFCTNGIVYGIPWGGDADTWRMIDGKLYIFGGRGSQDAFELDVPGNMKLAEKYWAEEVSGSNSFWQRSKRLVFKVPHYKSGDELAKAVADAKARK